MKSFNARFRKANPVNLSRILTSVIREIGCEENIYFEQLKKNWESIVGETNARNTKPVALDNGILTVAVSSPGWLTELRFSKVKFIENINSFETIAKLTVKDINFILDKSR